MPTTQHSASLAAASRTAADAWCGPNQIWPALPPTAHSVRHSAPEQLRGPPLWPAQQQRCEYQHWPVMPKLCHVLPHPRLQCLHFCRALTPSTGQGLAFWSQLKLPSKHHSLSLGTRASHPTCRARSRSCSCPCRACRRESCSSSALRSLASSLAAWSAWAYRQRQESAHRAFHCKGSCRNDAPVRSRRPMWN